MEKSEIIKEVNDIIITILDNKDIVLTNETKASDIEEWDSLNHMLLVVELESHFKIKITSGDIKQWDNVGQMCEFIYKKLNP